MNTKLFLTLCTASLLSASLGAQITYIDADATTNTTLADGSTFTPTTTVNNSDDQWSNRPFANGMTVYSTNDAAAAGKEDGPMLRTTITGLRPLGFYNVYSYWWNANGSNDIWRGRALVSNSTTPPTPELPGYNTFHFASSSFSPMTPLSSDGPVGASQTALGLTRDAANFETSGHFKNKVLLQEGNRWLYELSLGVHRASPRGEIHVYIDDLANTSNGNRTWYDGVGYDLAPQRFGIGCGSPSSPVIASVGAPIVNSEFGVTLTNAGATKPALLVLGASKTTWLTLNLPLDLQIFGYSGCPLNVSLDLTFPAATDTNGDAAIRFPVPQTTATVYWQWLIFENASTLSVTPGLESQFRR